jgi:hypothetical protein
MPELDSTSPYYHLATLCQEYQELIDLLQGGMLDTEDLRILQGQRSVIHDQIMEEMTRLGLTYADRAEAMRKAIKIARWTRGG